MLRACIPALLLCLLPLPTSAQGDAGMDERLAACAACHGDHGEGAGSGEYVPHLSGKPQGYLLDQLQAFRDGRRHFGQMVWLVRNMDDAYLARIAAHYAALPPLLARQRTASNQDAAQDRRARQLVHQGDAALEIPACSACHGENLAGMEPGVPALLGLPADYLIAQLGAWRTGARAGREPDCMRAIAQALPATDLRVLANWLAAQDNPTQARPAPAGTLQPPLRCGSLPVQDDTP